MKGRFAWLILPFLLCALGYSRNKAQRPNEQTALLDRYMAAWNAHDAAAASDFLDDKVEYYDTAAGTLQGRAEARSKVIGAFMNAAPDLSWSLDAASRIITPDAIAFSWTLTGTNTGAWADGTKATGKPFTVRGATLLRLEKGKIAFQGDYYDAGGLNKQLGL